MRRMRVNRPVGNSPGIWAKIGDMIAKCPNIRFEWVPSHGKKLKEWSAPEGHDGDEWRRLNDAADKEASAALERRWIREAP